MEPHFDSGFFAENRKRLRKALSKDQLIVLAGHGLVQKSRDEAYPFRQESSFWYLSAVDEPNFVLVIDGEEDYLIMPKRSDYLNIFSGKLDKQKLRSISGVSQVFENELGWCKLQARLKKTREVATTSPLPDYVEQLGMYTNPAVKNVADKLNSYNPKLRLTDLRKHLSYLRSVKTDGELRCIKKAIEESIKLHTDLADNLAQFKTESDVIEFIKAGSIKKDLDLPYEPIAATGKNACVLHYTNGLDKLSPGEPLLVDAAFSYNGYSSDLTRSYCLKPGKRYRQVHDAVVEVQQHAIDLLKPGVKLEDYEKSAKQFMGKKLKQLGLISKTDDKSISKYYMHRTSHFLGLDVHDAADPSKPLEPGMVLTVEPGIYIPDESIGIRIEDNVLINKKSNEVLSSKLPKFIEVS